MEESLIIEVWDTFKDYIPEKNRDTAANQFVDFLIGRDVDTSILESVMGYDPHLDNAIELVLGEENQDDDNDSYDEDGYDYEDDEDY
jgi:hypothetical protein